MSRPHAVGLKQSSLFALVTLFSLALANDTDLPSSIVGCKEVSCPYSTSDTCTLANKTFNGIGLARIPDVPSSLNGLSLVKGVGIPDPEDVPFNLSAKSDSRPYGARAYDSVYYLGAPPELDFSDLSGCAVTFNNASAEFDGKDAKKAKGTCPDILDQKCIDSITKRARDIVSNAKGDSCSALSRELKNHSFDECRGLTAGNRDRLGNFTVSFLNNLSPIFGSSNSSSDCWPIIPKSDNLAKISENLVLGEPTTTSMADNLYNITPVLTVFAKDNETTAQLTCLKLVTEPRPGVVEEGRAASPAYNLLGMGVTALAVALFTMV